MAGSKTQETNKGTHQKTHAECQPPRFDEVEKRNGIEENHQAEAYILYCAYALCDKHIKFYDINHLHFMRMSLIFVCTSSAIDCGNCSACWMPTTRLMSLYRHNTMHIEH